MEISTIHVYCKSAKSPINLHQYYAWIIIISSNTRLYTKWNISEFTAREPLLYEYFIFNEHIKKVKDQLLKIYKWLSEERLNVAHMQMKKINTNLATSIFNLCGMRSICCLERMFHWFVNQMRSTKSIFILTNATRYVYCTYNAHSMINMKLEVSISRYKVCTINGAILYSFKNNQDYLRYTILK